MRYSTTPELVMRNTHFIVAETIEHMKLSAYFFMEKNPSNKAENILSRLVLERVITNLHQLIVTYEKLKLINIDFNFEQKKSFERIRTIRQALVHAGTPIEQIEKKLNSWARFFVAHRNTLALKTDNTILSNNFVDDVKIFYGKEFVFLKRDLMNLTCKIVEYYNIYAEDFLKLNNPFVAIDLYDLTDAEPL